MPLLESIQSRQSKKGTLTGLGSIFASMVPKKISWKMVLFVTLAAYMLGIVGMLLRAVAIVGVLMVYVAAVTAAVAFLVLSVKAYSYAYHMQKSATDLLISDENSRGEGIDTAALLIRIRDETNDRIFEHLGCSLETVADGGRRSSVSKDTDDSLGNSYAVNSGIMYVMLCSALLIVLGVLAALVTRSLLMGAIVTSLCAVPAGLGVAGFIITELVVGMTVSSLATYDLALRNIESASREPGSHTECLSDAAYTSANDYVSTSIPSSDAGHIYSGAASGVTRTTASITQQVGGSAGLSLDTQTTSGKIINGTRNPSGIAGGPFVDVEADLPSTKVDTEPRIVAALYTMHKLIV